MSQPKAKMNIPMCAACVLLCLTLFSMHLTGGLYAKYTAKGNGGDDARVAAFNVVTKGDAAEFVEIHCNDSTKDNVYDITITNKSEVAVHYEMSVTAIAGVNAQFNETSGDLAPNDTVGKNHYITFTVSDWNTITKDVKAATASIEIGFTVTIDVVQID